MSEIPALPIRRVTRLNLTCDAWRWPFADQRRDEIEAYFAGLRANKPQLWNGPVLLARDPCFDGATFSARYFQTDFASFLAWRDWGFPDPAVINGFGIGALRGNDGGFVLGEMASQTANAGRVYFASGMLDLSDRHDDRVDMDGNVRREVAEETGLTPDDYTADVAWDIIASAGRVAMIRKLQTRVAAATLRARIATFIARQTDPELSAAHVVCARGDISARMPDFIAVYLAAQFDGPAPAVS